MSKPLPLIEEAITPPRKRKQYTSLRTFSKDHGSQDWYTPESILAPVRQFLGADYLDPCPPSWGHAPKVNGLAIPWAGRAVFCNPPYGRAIRPWIAKACGERTRDLILLVPASTDCGWFSPLLRWPICFLRGRMKFGRPNGDTSSAPNASVLAYRGRRVREFADTFDHLGPILRPYRAIRPPQVELMPAAPDA